MSIKEDIQNNKIKNVYLFCGVEDFMKDYYCKTLINKYINPSSKSFNYLSYNQEKPTFEEVDSFIDSYPFMSEKKVIYIKNSSIFKKSTEIEKEYWLSTINNLPEYVLLIFSENEVDKRGSLYKKINADFSVEEINTKSQSDLKKWVGAQIMTVGKKIKETDCDYLIECCNFDMYTLQNEISKLLSFKPQESIITREDIDICCIKMPESKVFDMIDEILGGKIESASKKFSDLKKCREEPLLINGAVFSKYNSLRAIKVLSGTKSSREIADILGSKSDYYIKKDMAKVKTIKLSKLDDVIKACQNADKSIKSGLLDEWTSIELVFATMIK